MYRSGSSVTRAISDANGRGLGLDLYSPVGNQSASNPALTNQHICHKLDQMMELISNNQRMLVEQQSAQVIIGEKLEKVCGDVQQLQKEVNDLQSHSVSSSVDNKRKVKVPSQISLMIKRLYGELEDYKFDGSQPYSAEQNKKAHDFIFQQLKSHFDDTHETSVVKRAIYRYYESRRRMYNDSLPRRKEMVETKLKNQKKANFKRRLYERRVKCTKNDEEKRIMEQLDCNYMTEESESDGTVRRHELKWRSEGVTKLLHKLDQRSSKKGNKFGSGQFCLKSRVDASPAEDNTPPPNAPRWAVKTSVNPGPSSSQMLSTTPSGATSEAVIEPRRRISFANIESELDRISSEDSSSDPC